MSALSDRRAAQRKRALQVPVASMGDIAFLLIIFFMLCSNFAKQANIKAESPHSPLVQKLKESMNSVIISDQGVIHLNGQVIPDAQGVEYALLALIKNSTTDDGRTVMFKCDRNVDKQVYEPVLDAIAAAGGLVAAIGERGDEQR